MYTSLILDPDRFRWRGKPLPKDVPTLRDLARQVKQYNEELIAAELQRDSEMRAEFRQTTYTLPLDMARDIARDLVQEESIATLQWGIVEMASLYREQIAINREDEIAAWDRMASAAFARMNSPRRKSLIGLLLDAVARRP